MIEIINDKLRGFFGNSDAGFKLFSWQHFFPLIVAALLIYLIFRYREQIRNSKLEIKYRNTLAVLLLVSHMSFMWHALVIGDLNIGNILPLMLCYMSMLLGIFMLLNKSQYLFDLLYFWVLCGSLTSLFYPATVNQFSFLKFRYYQFWVGHIGIVVMIFYMIFVLGFRVNFRSLIRSFVWIVIYAAFTLYINYTFNANYMFLTTDSTYWNLGFIPPFPMNIVFMLSAGIVLMAVAYLPFHYINKRNKLGTSV